MTSNGSVGKGRIGYIDAMRGLTMVLVVYSHVCNYCLGDVWMGYNDVFFLFRLPCFFFISGWLFEPRSGVFPDVRGTIRHKFMVQIVPTVIFLLLLAPPPLFFSRLGATKGGYWFTFALFEFFLFYLFSKRWLKEWGFVFAIVLSLVAFAYDASYNYLISQSHDFTILQFYDFTILQLFGFLGLVTWRYYLFFYIGTWVKRHFDSFIRWTDKWWVILLAIAVFSVCAASLHTDRILREYLVFAFGGLFGLTVVFTAFRLCSLRCFNSDILKFIGTRTLDIYLLHYFVLPRFLLFHSEWLRSCDSKPLQLLVALAIALVVVAVCLLVSYVIRLNPFLGHYLFGAKYEQQK